MDLTLPRQSDFAEHVGHVRVLGSEMLTGSRDGQPVLAVVGTLKNESPLTWRNVSLEVQFTDDEGSLIDVERLRMWRQTVGPGQTMSFAAHVAPELPIECYAGHAVFIRSARGPYWFD